MSWLVIGISGVTCSGKSTLAKTLYDYFSDTTKTINGNVKFGIVKLIKQDSYFFHRSSPEHTWIPDMNYINREFLSAFDMQRMRQDIDNILLENQHEDTEQNLNIMNILIIEGFLLFNDATVKALCNLKIDMKISYEECFKRRKTRNYNPPNPSGYFEAFIWPYYQKHLLEYQDESGLMSINGELDETKCFELAK